MNGRVNILGVEEDYSFSMSFLIPSLIKKGVKKMKNLKVEFANELDLSVADESFYSLLLEYILDYYNNKKEG